MFSCSEVSWSFLVWPVALRRPFCCATQCRGSTASCANLSYTCSITHSTTLSRHRLSYTCSHHLFSGLRSVSRRLRGEIVVDREDLIDTGAAFP